MEREKHGCVWHIHDAVCADHVVSPDRSTSELTVSDWVLELTSDFHGCTHHHHGYKRGMADASTSRVRARQVFLRQSGYGKGASPVRYTCGITKDGRTTDSSKASESIWEAMPSMSAARPVESRRRGP